MKLAIASVFAALTLLFGAMARAEFPANPQVVPADRLIRNIESILKKDPQNPHWIYTLGRIHYLCFANRSLRVPAWLSDDGHPIIPPERRVGDFDRAAQGAEATSRTLSEFGVSKSSEIPAERHDAFYTRKTQIWKRLNQEGWRSNPLGADAATSQAEAALILFDRAIDLDPKNALYLLGRASLGKQWQDFRDALPPDAPSMSHPNLDRINLRGILSDFFKAHESAFTADAAAKERPMGGLSEFVSYEAGQGFLNLMKNRARLTETDQLQIAKVCRQIAKLAKLPPTKAVTPIIFSLEAKNKLLSDSLADNSTVSFDLAGAELKGIAAWFDRNSNGVSDPGEVVGLASLGIQSIATHSAGRDGDALMNPAGIQFESGRTLPTWDWIATPSR